MPCCFLLTLEPQLTKSLTSNIRLSGKYQSIGNRKGSSKEESKIPPTPKSPRQTPTIAHLCLPSKAEPLLPLHNYILRIRSPTSPTTAKSYSQDATPNQAHHLSRRLPRNRPCPLSRIREQPPQLHNVRLLRPATSSTSLVR